MSEWQRFEAAHEAQAEVARRAGPTSDRYSSALARYVAAVGDVAEHEAGHGSPLSEELRWNIEQNLVRDVMTRRVVCVSEDATFKEIVDLLARHRISAVPVVDAELRVVGVVSESDLLANVVAGGDPRARIGTGHSARVQARRKSRAETAGELMNSPAVTTSPDISVVHAARAAAMAYVRRLPVVDANGTLVGIVARSDLLRVFLRDDEKIRAHLVEVLADQFCIDTVTVDVHDGVVTLLGQVERRLLITALVETVRATAGVVGVHDNLTYRVDDRYLPPSPLY